MRTFYLLALSLSTLPAAAVTLDVPRLPAPSFADREVSYDAALPGNRLAGLRTFRLELTVSATPSNSVQVAFGRDCQPADGALAAEETDFIVGWDCGEWFLRPRGLRERHTFAPAPAAGPRTLTAFMRIGSTGVPHTPVFADGGVPFAFGGLPLSPFPDWLRPDRWTDLRVTARGGATNEVLSVKFAPDGAQIIFR